MAKENLDSLITLYRKQLKMSKLEFISVSGLTHLIEVGQLRVIIFDQKDAEMTFLVVVDDIVASLFFYPFYTVSLSCCMLINCGICYSCRLM